LRLIFAPGEGDLSRKKKNPDHDQTAGVYDATTGKGTWREGSHETPFVSLTRGAFLNLYKIAHSAPIVDK
jgi:hypothetical protein